METNKEQWYMREDYRPETVEGKNFGPFLRELQKIGNLFDSLEECTDFCNSIRRHLGLNELVVAKRDNTPESNQMQKCSHQGPLRINLSLGESSVSLHLTNDCSCTLQLHIEQNAHDHKNEKMQGDYLQTNQRVHFRS